MKAILRERTSFSDQNFGYDLNELCRYFSLFGYDLNELRIYFSLFGYDLNELCRYFSLFASTADDWFVTV